MSNSSDFSPVMQTYARFPLRLLRGKGSELFDDKGNRYLDFLGGLSVSSFGHCPEKMCEALKKQVDTLWHCSNLYHIPQQEALAELLTQKSFADQAFFCNSGAEAIEASLKLARHWANKHHGKARPVFVAANASFHGRTMGSLSVTHNPVYREPFAPLVQSVRFVPFGDVATLEATLSDDVAGLILEPMQAEGGLNLPPAGYLEKARELCSERGIALIFDEVQVGMGRLGKMFAYQVFGVEPDIIALAKGLGAGFPVGAMLAKREFSRYFEPGTHGSTFGGGPLAATVALEVVKQLCDQDFMNTLQQRIYQLNSELSAIVARHSSVTELRGLGMLVGFKCSKPVGGLIQKAMEAGILIGSAGASKDVVRLAPALNIPAPLLSEGLNILDGLLKDF